ncbi:hypothetical protein Q664_00760 [Archangium violaceum Cb vi76]|uniref:Radical SAM core domain-containing protein n=1 Tax=Archangium violaceum Cb vi76 TaxID=1406225 RepID=A0A084T206_9BACT|nr:hypothetical protein Q664_00760 [Archangium violaceum Cb vi76]
MGLTLDFYKRNYIEGLFLGSGVLKSPDYTMEELVQVARTLREQHQFQGYIHLKAVPGASQELIDQAGRYADRLSANIELPTDADLSKLAPEKSFAVTGETMREIHVRVGARFPHQPEPGAGVRDALGEGVDGDVPPLGAAADAGRAEPRRGSGSLRGGPAQGGGHPARPARDYWQVMPGRPRYAPCAVHSEMGPPHEPA